MTLPAYSVALPVRNEIHTLADVVAAYVGQAVAPSEILLCVNGSTDGTLELARRLEAEHPRLVRVIESDAADRKPGAWRAGFAEATNDLVLFGDGDALPAPENGRVLVEVMVSDARIAAVAAAICIVRPDRPRSLFDWFSPDHLGVRPGAPRLQGPQYLLHRHRWREVIAELGIPLMPDVVSDDGYIGCAIGMSRDYIVVGDSRARAYIQPIRSLHEYNLAFCRLGQAGMQFDDFPPLQTPPAPPQRHQLWRDVSSRIRHGIRERDLLLVTKALGTAWYTLSWRILLRYADRVERFRPAAPSQDDLWSLRTAKARFSPRLVAAVRADTLGERRVTGTKKR